MKKPARAAAILMAVILFILPLNALAQEQTGSEMVYLTVDRIQAAMAGAPAIDIGLAINLIAGLNQAGDRGLWVLDLSGAEINALTLAAAMENGQVKAYLQNGLGGLPHILTASLDSLKDMASAYLPVEADGVEGSGAALQQSLQALAKATDDPAERAALWGKALPAFEKAFGLTAAGDATIELFGASQNARTFSGETDFAGLWAALPEIFAADPALQACFDEAVALLEESGALGPGMGFADLPGLLRENDADMRIAITEYLAGEYQSRLELAMTALEKGEEAGTITLTLDSDIRPDRSALSVTIGADAPDSSEGSVWIALESSQTPHESGEDGYLGLLVEFEGETESAFAFQSETQRINATANGPAADRALLSAAVILEDQTSFAASVRYDADRYEENGMPTRKGSVTVQALQNGENLMQLSFDILLQETSLPAGELFSIDDSITLLDVTEMDEAQAQALNDALETLMNNTLALLFQIPGIAALLGGEGGY